MTDDSSAQVTKHVDAAPDRVWTALTDAAALTAWYWPATMQPTATSDPRAGGAFGIATSSPDTGFSGRYLEFDPPRRLVQTWRWAGAQTDSRVTIDLTPAGSGTDVVVVHDRVDAETADMYRQGWESCLRRLPGYLG